MPNTDLISVVFRSVDVREAGGDGLGDGVLRRRVAVLPRPRSELRHHHTVVQLEGRVPGERESGDRGGQHTMLR